MMVAFMKALLRDLVEGSGKSVGLFTTNAVSGFFFGVSKIGNVRDRSNHGHIEFPF
jgi:hypothetical protein